MSAPIPDVINFLIGTPTDAHLDLLRARREKARDNAQLSYLALLRPEMPGDVAIC